MSVVPIEPLQTPARRFVQAARERWIKLAAFVFGVAVVSAVIALLMKPWYAAETTLLPPSEGTDMFSNLAGLIESSALSRVGLFSSSTPADVYVEILKSRRLRQAMVNKYDLKKTYDLKYMDPTLKELDKHLSIRTTEIGVVVVRMEDPNKARVAEMANFLVSELDRFNRETLQTRGKRTRQFLEARLAELEERMAKSEAEMTAYEQKHKVVLSTDESSMRGLGDVLSQKLALEVKRSYMQSYSQPGSPGVDQVNAEIDAFDRELARLPALKNEGARLALDTQIQRKLFAFVTAQVEQARVDELRDTPTVSVLDEAQTPEFRSRPRRSIMVLGATFVAALLAAGWVAWTLYRPSRA